MIDGKVPLRVLNGNDMETRVVGENERLHHGLEQQALLRADSIALKKGSVTYTYSEINGLANYVAGELLAQIESPNALIAILSEDPAKQLTFVFGIWKAGMTALVLDPRDPETRLRSITVQAGTDKLITDTASIDQARHLTAAPCVLDLDRQNAVSMNPDISSESPALVVYTSGSTGIPNGVARTHRNHLRECNEGRSHFGLEPDYRCGQLLPLNFAAGVKYAMNTVLTGGMLSFYDINSKGLTPFYDWLRSERITILPAPVAFFRRFLHDAPDSYSCEECKYVLLGGARVYKRDVEKFRRIFGETGHLVHVYGSTETGMIACHHIDGSTPIADPLPVGTPLHEVRIVETGDTTPLSKGAVGEIAVVSRDLPLGYWRDPELTTRKYLAVAEGDGRRMYLTGDFGRFDDEGLLYLHNRKDMLSKVRGFRVDAGEIELALNGTEGVIHAEVVRSEDSAGETRLTAYVSLSDPQERRPQRLRKLKESLSSKLPSYMMPDKFVSIDAIPTTSRGKVDRKALTSKDVRTPGSGNAAPISDTEQKVIDVWKNFFEMEDIHPDDDILDLGVKSLPAMAMCQQLCRLFYVDIPYAQLVLSPTVRELAGFIDARLAEKNTGDRS